MRSPRHRWVSVAQRQGLPFQPDGLSFRVSLDKQSTELLAVLKGKSKSRLYQKAYSIFLSDSARASYEILLFATGDVAKTAEILKAFPEEVQTYADCFFDVTVFAGTTEKLMYLDRIMTFDQDMAVLLRNAMQMSPEELAFIADKGTAARVAPKEAIENGLKIYHNMMMTFVQPELESLVQENVPEERIKRFDRLMRHARDCSKETRAYAELMLKYELDKTADAFLENFKIALTPRKATEFITPKPKEGEGPTIY
jgi:hypothetical protein